MILVVGLLLAADDPKDEVTKELERFHGTWTATSAEVNGKSIPKDNLKGILLTITGEKFTIKSGDTTIEGTITRVDPSKTPKEYDASGKEQGKETKSIGIYQFDGDTLKVCYREKGDRPKEFSSKGGTDDNPMIVTVYKREKTK
jgi:uncharacterized protein (TIGR03067 family)